MILVQDCHPSENSSNEETATSRDAAVHRPPPHRRTSVVSLCPRVVAVMDKKGRQR